MPAYSDILQRPPSAMPITWLINCGCYVYAVLQVQRPAHKSIKCGNCPGAFATQASLDQHRLQSHPGEHCNCWYRLIAVEYCMLTATHPLLQDSLRHKKCRSRWYQPWAWNLGAIEGTRDFLILQQPVFISILFPLCLLLATLSSTSCWSCAERWHRLPQIATDYQTSITKESLLLSNQCLQLRWLRIMALMLPRYVLSRIPLRSLTRFSIHAHISTNCLICLYCITNNNVIRVTHRLRCISMLHQQYGRMAWITKFDTSFRHDNWDLLQTFILVGSVFVALTIYDDRSPTWMSTVDSHTSDGYILFMSIWQSITPQPRINFCGHTGLNPSQKCLLHDMAKPLIVPLY